MENPQAWLSLTGICTTLNMAHGQIKWLAKNGFLTMMWGDKSKTWAKARYLDPTPEYAAKLKLGEALYGRIHPVPIDLDLAPMLTIREVAVIMGWNQNYARQFTWKNKLPCVKVGNTQLYSIATVRNLIWKRTGRARAVNKQQGPFLLHELIDFFLKCKSEAEQEVPTDEQFAQDDLIQRKLVRIGKMKTPHRELAMQDFMTKVALAKSAVESLGT